ncbi:MAG: hypothetical protein A4S14_01730 [Proteobacteria bacterium SG_bin9]|nr:MAG: hypothetical protein A4S14_01730 [Proteobacteria bacterium SG_bin9]
MDKVVHDAIARMVRNFIEDRGFALFAKLIPWLEARTSSLGGKLAAGLLLGLTAIASVVTVRALSGF